MSTSFLLHNFRFLIAALGFFGALFAPPWVPLLMMGILAFRYAAWEALAIGLLVDLLWLPSGSLMHSLPLFTLAGLLLVWGLEPIRREFLA